MIMERMTCSWTTLLFIICLKQWMAKAEIPADGLCSIHLFLPFTFLGTTDPLFLSQQSFSHLASAYLASQDFNSHIRNEIYPSCTISLNITATHDTAVLGNFASVAFQNMIRNYQTPPTPCAIAGLDTDLVAERISILATSLQIPTMIHRALNLRVSSELFTPFSTQTYPSAFDIELYVASFTQTILQRYNYICLVYAVSDSAIQRHELALRGFVAIGKASHVTSISFDPLNRQNSIADAFRQVKETGFRTIVIVADPLDLQLSILEISNQAAHQGLLDNGEYVFVFDPGMELTLPKKLLFTLNTNSTDNSSKNNNVTKLLTGAAIITPIERHYYDASGSSFIKSWQSQNQSTVEYIQQLLLHTMNNNFNNNNNNTMKNDAISNPNGGIIISNYFESTLPQQGSGYLYDAILSIGLGACIAQKQSSTLNILSKEHVHGIRSINYPNGATGTIKYGTGITLGGLGNSGIRSFDTSSYGAFNILSDGSLTLTHIITPSNTNNQWTQKQQKQQQKQQSMIQFIFANNSTIGPELLRDIPNQNYLSSYMRYIGFTMFGISIFIIIGCTIWIFVNRQHRIVRASQPPLLLLLLLGCAITTMSLLVISFDERHISENGLNSLCKTLPWFIVIGHIATHGALFTKLWRVNMVLEFTLAKIELHHVVWPMRILTAIAVAILTAWTIFEPIEWVREEVNFETGESFGACQGGDQFYYIWFLPILVLMVTPTILTFLMAWKTKHVDSTFSESWWIFALIFIQFQTMAVSLPLVVILNGLSSTDGRYIGFALILWTIPMSTTIMIFAPKLVALYYIHSNSQHHDNNNNNPHSSSLQRRGGPGGTVRVTGIGGVGAGGGGGEHHQQQQQQQIDALTSRFASENRKSSSFFE